MCTIIVLNQVHAEFPVVVAANREEFYARPTAGPEVLLTQPVAVGGRDLLANGTWMGATAGGLFVGLTNQRSYSGNVTGLRSRGELVVEALRAGSREAVRALMEATDASLYNSFNLIYGDAAQLEVAHGRRQSGSIEIEEVPTGVSALSNDRLDAPDFPKVQRARQLSRKHIDAPWPALSIALHQVLGDHQQPQLDDLTEPPPGSVFDRQGLQQLQALCVHTPVYGTRSSTVMALRDGGVAHYLHAEGPACQSQMRDVSELLNR